MQVFVRWVSLAMITAVVSRLAAGSGLVPGDVWVALQLQALQVPGLDVAISWTNWFGQGILRGVIATSVLIIGLVLSGFRAEALLLLATGGCRLLNAPIKLLLNSPRPSLNDVAVVETAAGFGYPSGHTMSAVLFFGTLIIIAPAVVPWRWLQLLVQAIFIALIIITGIGRVIVGAHWPSDTLGGVLFGFLFLIPLGWLYHQYRWRINLRPVPFFRPGSRPRIAGA